MATQQLERAASAGSMNGGTLRPPPSTAEPPAAPGIRTS